MDSEALLAQIDNLCAEVQEIRGNAKYGDLSDRRQDLDRMVVRCQAAIERMAPAGTAYRREADDAKRKDSSVDRVPLVVGILEALRADIAAGWMSRFEELVHADVFADFIEMSDELMSKGYKDAAAVVIGSVLEAHLRALCSKQGVTTLAPRGGPKKADTMNADLVKASAYAVLQQKQVTAWLAIRNAAAHGEYDKFTASDVSSMIGAVREFLLRYPA